MKIKAALAAAFLMIAGVTGAYALTCNAEARAQCEAAGHVWDSTNCTCSGSY